MIYGYTRVSTAEQVNGTSLDDQLNRVKGVAMMRGEEVAEVFTDGGVSGSISLRDRPQGRLLVEALKSGDTVIVAKLDRIFRSAADALTMVDEFKRAGIDLIISDMGSDPVTQNGVSKMFFGMLACVAEFERSRIAERITAGKLAKKTANGYVGGKRPFGWDIRGVGKEAVLVENPTEQAALARIMEMRSMGLSYGKIATALKGDGFSLPPMSIKRIVDRKQEAV